MDAHTDLQAVLENEFKLRDHIASHIEDLEKGLRILKKEYELLNARGGAGGRTDILAADELDHIVVIEVKRSDKTAREAIHELSKYISLLIERDRVPRELIRCVVVSTVWHELELPLAYFRATAQVDVIGLEPYVKDNALKFSRRDLLPVSTLPQFSPEFSIYHYEDKGKYDMHIARIRERIKTIPFARVASCLFEASSASGEADIRAIMCLWRIQPRDYEVLESAMGESIGHLFPYAYPGWEAECDCLSWLADRTAVDCTVFYSAESERGTPEKVSSISNTHSLVQIDRLGDSPQLEIVNTFERILSQLTAVAGLTGTPRRNRHWFNAAASPQFLPSWRKTRDEFINFLRGVPQWQAFVADICSQLEDLPDLKVTFTAFDKNHFFYALHQCTGHKDVALSSFRIVAHQGDNVVFVGEGSWEWDGSDDFGPARQEIEKAFGSTFGAVLAAYSAVDMKRYEDAYIAHGFHPYIRILERVKSGKQSWADVLRFPNASLSLAAFVERHLDYVSEVSEELRLVGHLPTSPPFKEQ
ncbi:endonuclease NucS domain-containing protein [Cupriavidus plantarum]|uniref:endonuclease NucS domain-containing protein n=1 Tax=Cupriavidus plantarum TaxID=942865 RepID=UPI000EAEC2E0|nr:endonuclease NucS domain-containing protein [Cupriavidus plantarum]RLK45206.1 uncharacterized protein DUF91 [Cupriavidus plantarum]